MTSVRKFAPVMIVILAFILASAGRGQQKAPAGEPKTGATASKTQPEKEPSSTSVENSLREELRGLAGGGQVTLAGRALRGIVIVVCAWLLYRVAVAGLRRVETRLKRIGPAPSGVQTRRQQHVTTVTNLMRSLCGYLIIIGAAILLLDWSFGLNVIPIITGAGLLGLAVAFGSQALVRDVVTGLFQLLEGQYAVGDYVQIGSAFGKVEEVGLRVTRLRDLQDRLHFIPNGSISLVTTYDDPFTDYVLQAPVAAAEQGESALQAVRLLSSDLRREFPELIGYADEPEIVSGESGLTTVKMRLGIAPTQDWIATTEIPARVKELFVARGIGVPDGRPPSCYLDTSPLARMPREISRSPSGVPEPKDS